MCWLYLQWSETFKYLRKNNNKASSSDFHQIRQSFVTWVVSGRKHYYIIFLYCGNISFINIEHYLIIKIRQIFFLKYTEPIRTYTLAFEYM